VTPVADVGFYQLNMFKKTARLSAFCNSILPVMNIRVTPVAGWPIYRLKTVTCPSSSTPSFLSQVGETPVDKEGEISA
jgi:hypothetical protein